MSALIIFVREYFGLTVYFFAVRYHEEWDEDDVKTVEILRLQHAPIEKEPNYVLADESPYIYKRDNTYTPDREWEEPLPGEADPTNTDPTPESTLTAKKVALCQKIHDLQCEILSGMGVDACKAMADAKIDHIIEAVQTTDRQCPLCHKTLKSSAAIKTHLRAKHQKKTPYQCQLCDRYLGDNQLLKAHLKTHSEANRFKCSVEGCGRGYPTQGRLNSHKKTHDEENYVKELQRR